MKKLATIDFQDYGKTNKTQIRHASRAIVYNGEKILMIHSLKNGDYKLPGGGQKVFENQTQALIRETKEETGFDVVESSIKEFGYVEEIRQSIFDKNGLFKMISSYYFCEIDSSDGKRNLDEYEALYQYVPVFVNINKALKANSKITNLIDFPWIKRENLVLNLLLTKQNEE